MFAFLFISKAVVLAQLPGAAVGFIAGAFCPAVLRKVKAFFVKETSAAKSAVAAEVGKVAGDVAKKL